MTKPVGYGSPPDYGKWKKGQSGNPSGRKKGNRNLKTDLEEELREIIHVSEGGKPKKLTRQRAMLKALTARAIKGDTRAASLMLGLVAKLFDSDDRSTSTELDPADDALLEAYIADRIALNKGNQS